MRGDVHHFYAMAGATFFMILFFAAGSAGAATVPEENLVQFVAGLYLIIDNDLITEEERPARYRELKRITGLERIDTADLIRRYRDDPAAWKNILDRAEKAVKK